MSALSRILERYLEPRIGEVPLHGDGRSPSMGGPETVTRTLASIPAVGSDPAQIDVGGFAVLLDPDSHAGGRLEISFDARPGSSVASWQPLTPGKTARPQNGARFGRFWVRKRSTVPSGLDAESVYFVVDPGETEGTYDPRPRAPQLSAMGSAHMLLRLLTLAGAEVEGRGSDEGAIATAGWDGAAYQRIRTLAGALTDAAAAFGAGTLQVASELRAFNGATWDRVRALAAALTDAEANPGAGTLRTASHLLGWNGANWNRLRSNAAAWADGVGNVGGGLLSLGFNFGWNGASWDRLRAGIGAAGTGVLRTVGAVPATAPTTKTTVPKTDTSTEVRAANASRVAAMVFNAGADTAYVAVGEAATTSSMPLLPLETKTFLGAGAINALVPAAASAACDLHAQDVTW